MDFEALLAEQRQYFLAQHTKDLGFRKQQLQGLKRALLENEKDLYAAIYADFQKSEYEAFLTELAILIKDIDEACQKLTSWAKTRRVRTNFLNWPGHSEIRPEPLGQCLVIGAWNYPIQLSLAPAIAALAAGNTVILKPSELAAHSAACMAKIVTQHFDPRLFSVVLGGVPETSELLKLRFDKIFFTGSPAVGRIVYEAAAKHLTPVTLELGGKSPALISPAAHLPTAIKRLVWAKFLNAGQTCIAPDYVFVHQSIYATCMQLLQQEIEKNQYALANTNYVQIINERNLARLEQLLDTNKIAFGGLIDKEHRTISPTLLQDVTFEDPIMQEEIFGPLLPLIPYTDFSAALHYIQVHEKPLAAYLFSEDRHEQEQWLAQLSFGGGCINDAIMHISNPNLPFGGVGQSGMGNYHGEAGFRTFSHYKSVFKKPRFEMPLKYPPYSKKAFAWIKRLLPYF